MPTLDPVVARWQQLLPGQRREGSQGYQTTKYREREQRRRMKQRAPNSDERQQLSITGSKPSHTTDYWGDKLTEKQEGIC